MGNKEVGGPICQAVKHPEQVWKLHVWERPYEENLHDAPQQVEINGRKLKIDSTNMWRNLQPSRGENSNASNIHVTVRIKTINGAAVPNNIHVDTVWLIDGNKIWKSPAQAARNRRDSDAMIIEVDHGPDWNVDTVDVVVLLKDGEGQSYLLRTSNQRISVVS